MICIHNVKPFTFRGLRFLKNHRSGDEDFLVKIGGVVHVGWVFYRRWEQWSSACH